MTKRVFMSVTLFLRYILFRYYFCVYICTIITIYTLKCAGKCLNKYIIALNHRSKTFINNYVSMVLFDDQKFYRTMVNRGYVFKMLVNTNIYTYRLSGGFKYTLLSFGAIKLRFFFCFLLKTYVDMNVYYIPYLSRQAFSYFHYRFIFK